MIKKTLTILLVPLIVLASFSAFAESFKPTRVAAAGYSQAQWLSNENSRALLVCLIARDFCDAGFADFKSVASRLLSCRSYIKQHDGLMVAIPNGDDYICFHIRFDSTNVSATFKHCSSSEAKTGDHTVKPEHCRTILTD